MRMPALERITRPSSLSQVRTSSSASGRQPAPPATWLPGALHLSHGDGEVSRQGALQERGVAVVEHERQLPIGPQERHQPSKGQLRLGQLLQHRVAGDDIEAAREVLAERLDGRLDEGHALVKLSRPSGRLRLVQHLARRFGQHNVIPPLRQLQREATAATPGVQDAQDAACKPRHGRDQVCAEDVQADHPL